RIAGKALGAQDGRRGDSSMARARSLPRSRYESDPHSPLQLLLHVLRQLVEQIPHRLIRPALRVLLDALVAGRTHRRAHALALAEAAPEILDLLRRHRDHRVSLLLRLAVLVDADRRA